MKLTEAARGRSGTHLQKYRQYLNVPFKEKDEAKKLGARWDNDKKKWYMEVFNYQKWHSKKHEHWIIK